MSLELSSTCPPSLSLTFTTFSYHSELLEGLKWSQVSVPPIEERLYSPRNGVR